MSEWQPIETAPKDGRDLLLFSNESTTPVMICHWSEAQDRTQAEDDGWYERDTMIFLDVQPTHWMPMPAAPEGDRP